MAQPLRPAPPFFKIEKWAGAINFQMDPRFSYDSEVVGELHHRLQPFLYHRMTSALVEEARARVCDVLHCGQELHHTVHYNTVDHPRGFPALYEHNCGECIYLGRGVDDVDLYIHPRSALPVQIRHESGLHGAVSHSLRERDEVLNVWVACLLAEEIGVI